MCALLKLIFEDAERVKIFHDCRRDAEAIHYLLGSCVKNVFDTSVIHNLILQLKQYAVIYSSTDDPQDRITQITKVLDDIRQPGLNDILSTYGAPHGVNELKETFHEKFNKGTFDF